MGIAAALFALAAAAILAVWGWLGMPVEMPQAPLGPGEKLHCVSYAPFRGEQNPFGPDVPIDPRQIDEDLAELKQIANCVRTYSVDHGLDQIPEIARRHGLKVMQGLWLSSLPDLSRKQIEGAVALANRYTRGVKRDFGVVVVVLGGPDRLSVPLFDRANVGVVPNSCGFELDIEAHVFSSVAPSLQPLPATRPRCNRG
mgnify:CR=1 FL=1